MTHILEDLTHKMVPVNRPKKKVDRWVLGICLVGGFNPFEKYYCSQIGSFPQVRVKIRNLLNHHHPPPKTRSFPIKTRVLCRYHPWPLPRAAPAAPVTPVACSWALRERKGGVSGTTPGRERLSPDRWGPGESSSSWFVGGWWFLDVFGGAKFKDFCWVMKLDSYLLLWHFLTSNSPKIAQLWRKNPLCVMLWCVHLLSAACTYYHGADRCHQRENYSALHELCVKTSCVTRPFFLSPSIHTRIK